MNNFDNKKKKKEKSLRVDSDFEGTILFVQY